MTIVQTVNFTLIPIRWLLKSALFDRLLPTSASLHHHHLHHCVLRHPLLSTTRAPPLETTRWSARGWLFQPSVTKNSSLLRVKRFCTPFFNSPSHINLYTSIHRRWICKLKEIADQFAAFRLQGNYREHILSGSNSSTFEDFLALS